MKTINNYDIVTENEITEFVSKSTPEENDYLKFVQGREDAGWVNFYFDNRGELFRVTQSCAEDDLSALIEFFKSLINLREEIAIFLEDENLSEPFLYASPVDSERIRFFLANGREIYR